jgi:integrase
LNANEGKFHVIADEEEKIYLMACPQPLQDVAALMPGAGMRPSEICNLKRGQVFLDRKFVQV